MTLDTFPNESISPAVIIGTGFHYRFATSDEKSPLVCWDTLLLKVAKSLQIQPPSKHLPPPMYWEAILLAVRERQCAAALADISDIKASQQIHQIEVDARKSVAELLNVTQPYNHKTAQDWLAPAGAVISLNFDHSWLGVLEPKLFDNKIGASASKRAASLNQRLFNSLSYKDVPVWFPNGSVLSPKSIRLGLRDYGYATEECRVGFDRLKQYQRECGPLDRAPTEAEIAEARAYAGWVADFMLRPLLFVGVGLFEAEQGLWWLLSQRARNVSKLDATSRPGAWKLLHRQHDKSKMAFWDARPMGVEPVWCDSWGDGWAKMYNILAGLSS